MSYAPGYALSGRANYLRLRAAMDALDSGMTPEDAIVHIFATHPCRSRRVAETAVRRAAEKIAARKPRTSKRKATKTPAPVAKHEPIDSAETARRSYLLAHFGVAPPNRDEEREAELARLIAEQDDDASETGLTQVSSGDALRGGGLVVRIEVELVDRRRNLIEGTATSWTAEAMTVEHADGSISTVLNDDIKALRQGYIDVRHDSSQATRQLPNRVTRHRGPAPGMYAHRPA